MTAHIIDAPIANFTDLLLDAVCMVDAAGHFVYVSAACEAIFGYTQQELIGRPMIELVLPADRARTLAAAHAVMAGQSHTHFENRYVRKDGTTVHIMWSARWSEPDQLRVAVARDVTAMRRAEAMRAALYALSEAAHASDDLPELFQRCHRILGDLVPAPAFYVALEEHAQQRMVYQAETQPGDPLPQLLCEHVLRSRGTLLVPGGDQRALAPALREAAATMTGCALAVPLATPDGVLGVLALREHDAAARYGDAERDLLLFVADQLANAIQRTQLRARLRFQAMHDELTGLPNRRLFSDRLDSALARARRRAGKLALLFIDLDRFKEINDHYGHACGDRLLQQVAVRLGAVVRASDTVARLGGDEFVILLEETGSPLDVDTLLSKVRQAFAAEFDLGGGISLPVAASIGVARYPSQGGGVDALLDIADAAMYAAKALAKTGREAA